MPCPAADAFARRRELIVIEQRCIKKVAGRGRTARRSVAATLVGMTGIEPALREELNPKSSASANSATSPGLFYSGFCHFSASGVPGNPPYFHHSNRSRLCSTNSRRRGLAQRRGLQQVYNAVQRVPHIDISLRSAIALAPHHLLQGTVPKPFFARHGRYTPAEGREIRSSGRHR